jgi:hypothetical protein
VPRTACKQSGPLGKATVQLRAKANGSLELAKRLKELGVKQESLYHWRRNVRPSPVQYEIVTELARARTNGNHILEEIGSAFTVAELLELTPHLLHNPSLSQHHTQQLLLEKQATQYRAMYVCADCMGKLVHIDRPTAADALAEIAVNLIDNKLWDPTKPLPFRAV